MVDGDNGSRDPESGELRRMPDGADAPAPPQVVPTPLQPGAAERGRGSRDPQGALSPRTAGGMTELRVLQTPGGTGRRGGGGRRGGDGGPQVPKAEPTSYYGKPILNPPVWTWEIPTYFFTGGLAGASGMLAAGATLAGNGPLARRASVAALAGGAVSPVLLISDLGRPARFLNMLRVFKVTSPMSVGTWALSGFGVASGLAAGWQLIGFPGRAIGLPAQLASAALGLPVATYTAVLITTTAVPAWRHADRIMPFVFAGSSMASAGGLAAAVTPREHARPAVAVGAIGGAVEVATSQFMKRQLDPRIRRSYEHDRVRTLDRAATACAAAGSIATAVGHARRSRTLTVAGGLSLVAGSLLERWAIVRAGGVSARDPEQTSGPQRDAMAAAG